MVSIWFFEWKRFNLVDLISGLSFIAQKNSNTMNTFATKLLVFSYVEKFEIKSTNIESQSTDNWKKFYTLQSRKVLDFL